MQKLLDSKISCGNEFYSVMKSTLNSNKCSVISFVNPFSYTIVCQEKELVENIDYFFSDGALLCKLHSLFQAEIRRASFDFSSIASGFFEYLESNSLSIAIVGAKQPEVELACSNLKTLFPKLNICYLRNGYIDDVDTFVASLTGANPDVVLLGMGSPYQERMSLILKSKLIDTSLIITCGGFLTQTSIKLDYYHPLIKRLGLRWLQRVVMHSHVRKRVLIDYPKFLVHYLLSRLSAK